MREKEIYVWACDLDKFRGEGILANEFIKDLKNEWIRVREESLDSMLVFIESLFDKYHTFKTQNNLVSSSRASSFVPTASKWLLEFGLMTS